MNLALVLLIGFTTLLIILLVGVLRDPRRTQNPDADTRSLEGAGRQHVTYFPQLRQAMAREDLAFLMARGSRKLARKVHKERRRIALAYLFSLHSDFLKLWQLARVIASMSPKVGIAQEMARLRLGMTFSIRYEMVRIKLLFGFAPLHELGALSEFVGKLAGRLETAMRDLGERAALATKLPSTLDGGGLNAP